MPIPLQTPRLHLRSFTIDDARLLDELDSDPEVLRYIGPRRQATIAEYETQIQSVFHSYDERFRAQGFWAVIDREQGEFYGWICLRPARDFRFVELTRFTDEQAELGYRLRRSAWGRGLATEAALAVIAAGWQHESMRTIVATALVDHRRSTRVMEKCGMSRQYEFQIDGYACPSVVYAVDRP